MDGDYQEYDYDLIVVGGGSGGIACAKEAAKYGIRAAIFDFVKPSTQGTTWKIGGTCVNVGCIPKKLMHTSALYSEHIEDSATFGWTNLYYKNGEEIKKVEGSFNGTDKNVSFDWDTLVGNVQSHIHSLNWAYPIDLKKAKVPYFNELVSFVDAHTIETVDLKGEKKKYTSEYFIIAVGGRPSVPKEIPGALEYAITSDDVFSLSHPPGKTLCVGASYISLETAGFLTGLGYDVSVMVREIILRGFDRECADKIKENMEQHGTRFLIPYSPKKIEKNESNGKLKVTYINNDDNETIEEEFDTVFFATGRYPDTVKLGCEKIGIKLDSKGKIITNDEEQSNIENVFAIGDVKSGGLELTPVAIMAGKLLARRLFAYEDVKMNYDLVPTTVFTPIEYGSCGISQEVAEKKYTKNGIVVYKKSFPILEYTPAFRDVDGFMKLICLKQENEKVIGFHYLGPNAGELTQGVAIAMKLGATKKDFDSTVGIHPTNAEIMTKLELGATSSGCAT